MARMGFPYDTCDLPDSHGWQCVLDVPDSSTCNLLFYLDLTIFDGGHFADIVGLDTGDRVDGGNCQVSLR